MDAPVPALGVLFTKMWQDTGGYDVRAARSAKLTAICNHNFRGRFPGI